MKRVQMGQSLKFILSTRNVPLAWLAILIVLAGMSLIYQFKSQRSVIQDMVRVWEPELVAAISEENWLLTAKIIRSFLREDLSYLQIMSDGRQVAAFPEEILNFECHFGEIRQSIERYGLQVAELRACANLKTLATRRMGSSTLIVVFAVLALSALSVVLPLHSYRRSLYAVMENLERWASAENELSGPLDKERGSRDEVVVRARSLVAGMIEARVDAQKKADAIEAQKRLVDFAHQVAHDIRSPLSALNVAAHSLVGVPDEPRRLLQAATKRIQGIANGLIHQFKGNPAGGNDTGYLGPIPSAQDLAELVISILEEKRLQYQHRTDVAIRADIQLGERFWAYVEPSEFLRVLSNLINNSMEAIETSGTVTVSLRKFSDSLLLVISDDGKGIPEEILRRVGYRGVSFGKENGESGSGLGLSHATEVAARFGGRLSIQSKLGVGTQVSITLPALKIQNPRDTSSTMSFDSSRAGQEFYSRELDSVQG